MSKNLSGSMTTDGSESGALPVVSLDSEAETAERGAEAAAGAAESAADAAADAEAPVVDGDVSSGIRDLLAVDIKDDEPAVYRALAQDRGLHFAVFDQLLAQIDPSLSAGISAAFQDHHHVIPISKLGNKAVVATSDPDLVAPELATALGCDDLVTWLVTPTDLRRLRMARELDRISARHGTGEAGFAAPDLLSSGAELDPELIFLFKAMLMDAVADRASDLHLEQHGGRVRVRLRVDGRLHDVDHYRITPAQLAGLINVIKVKSGLDIAERRRPQGGRAGVRVGDRRYDLRVQTQPSLYAEHAVIRLLPHSPSLLTIEDLGFPFEAASRYRRLLNTPSGLVLVVGPTGSGKSTTLYAGLRELAEDGGRKVITVEDPIEYAVRGLQQTEARPDIGFGFAQAMRAFVRQDPDVILVGEIRDPETALEAIRASQTGHLVLSTLHCNDCPDAIQRLLDLGMLPNSVASELRAVFSQRLARRICRSCRTEHAPDPELLAEIFPAGAPAGARYFKGVGCSKCAGRGHWGRIAVVETMHVTPRLRMAVSRRAPVDELRSMARGEGLVPLREHALQLVHDGIVEVAELRRILDPEQLAGEVLQPV